MTQKITDKGIMIQNVSFDNQFGIIKRMYYKASGIMREYIITDGKWDILSSTNIMYDIRPFFPMVK